MQTGRVLDVCPLLRPSTPFGRCYRGYISVAGVDFGLRLTLHPGGKLSHARLECDWRLSQTLREKESLVQKFLSESQDEATFLLKLRTMLEEVHRTRPASLPPPAPPAHYCQLLSDLEQLGWERVVHVSADFSLLKIRAKDEKEREHILSIHTSQHAQEPPTVQCDLPLPFKPSWSQKTTVAEMVQQFEEQLSRYQAFWEVMDQLDREAWVLEPEHPTPACVFRRIVISPNTSLYLIVDPRKPSTLPECKFLGPEHMVDPIRQKMVSRMTQWDPQLSLTQNLENLLNLQLPRPEASQQEGFSGECGICYAYRLEGVPPEMVCNNQHCTQPFHFACLFEWLKSLSTTRQSFGTLFGECPYCNEQITIKLQGQ